MSVLETVRHAAQRAGYEATQPELGKPVTICRNAWDPDDGGRTLEPLVTVELDGRIVDEPDYLHPEELALLRRLAKVVRAAAVRSGEFPYTP